jgi:putative ABC transport system permease protein
LFLYVLRKIVHNKWLMACLLVGAILAVSMVSSIPLYTDGILQRMLIKDLEQYQADSGSYPGRYLAQLDAFTYYRGKSRVETYNWFDKVLDPMVARLGLPYLKVKRIGMDFMTFLPEVQPDEQAKKVYVKLYGISDYEKHVEIVAGRLPAAEPADGVYEVLAAEGAQNKLNVLLDESLILSDETMQISPLNIRIVGLYRRPAVADTWWGESPAAYESAFLMDDSLMERGLVQESKAIVSAYWYYALDYAMLKVENLKALNTELDAQKKFMAKYAGTRWEFPAQKILKQYSTRSEQLKLTLWVLQVPILLMLAFYIFMVSRLVIENDRNEIAVLRSRGASGFQVFASYLLQSCLLSGITVIVGPFAALALCRVLGASNGFLEFVSRTALPLVMSWQTILYAACAGFFSVVMMMIPVVRAMRFTIVQHKQRRTRRWNVPLWQKFMLDIILLGISFYGLYQYDIRKKTIMVTAVEGVSVPIDPFLFIVSTVFVLGAGLLFLRLYPFAVRIVAWAGNRFWTPAMYLSFLQVGRSDGREQFLMLFLILTISIGVFSANSARTINQNIMDRESYGNGADITLQMDWPSNEVIAPPAGPGGTDVSQGGQGADQASGGDQVITYVEPDFSIYSKLAGTSAAARVFIPAGVVGITGQVKESRAGKLMAIVPNEFGKVAWSSPYLLPHHMNAYLNLMSKSPNAVLVSEALLADLKLKVGDPVSYRWGNQGEVQGVIYGAVPYWPSLNPQKDESRYFVIANLNYVQDATSMEPYQIWYARGSGATTRQIYDDIAAKRMVLKWMNDTKLDIVAKKNDPLLQGTNGALTLGFVVTMVISMIGFFIYWILSIRSRTLQFGIFRAMGVHARGVIMMLVFEQVMISGAAILTGLVTGGVMSQLFVPLLGLVYSAADQVPPFTVISSRADYVRLYAAVGTMLATGLALLGVLVSRINVTQAIKLGEE